jgi:hypothetical protein
VLGTYAILSRLAGRPVPRILARFRTLTSRVVDHSDTRTVGEVHSRYGCPHGHDRRRGLPVDLAATAGPPVLMDVVTDPNVLSMSPRATIRQAKGFALAMTKMAFAGEPDDVTDTVMANWGYL